MPAAKANESKQYVPQIDLKSYTTVTSNASSTVLSQTFVNPSSTIDVKECRYVFPLYDGVSVVNLTCQVGPRIIKGIVKEKAKAKEEYNAAVERGETAGLLEQGPTSDIFMTSLGSFRRENSYLSPSPSLESSSTTWAQVEYVLRSPQESALGESDFLHDPF